MKDYYQVLEVAISASQQEIKKAYRRLAQQFHPDKNPGDPYATARFAEIKEAYEVLTNPAKREYYLEQRWFHQSMGRKKTETVLTPTTLLKETLEMDRHVAKLDIHRMNKEGLYEYLVNELLSDEKIEKLNAYQELSANQQIISLVLKNLFVVPHDKLDKLKARLLKIDAEATVKSEIGKAIRPFDQSMQWEKYKIFVLLGIVILIILLIYFLS